MARKRRTNRNDVPIAISLGNALLDWGMSGDLPKALLWFYRYLTCDGEKLDDREVMPLILMIALKDGRDGYELRLRDLPTATPEKQVRNYLTKWKQMGLLFTSREYYTREEMRQHFGTKLPRTPRMRHVVFDLSNLMHNIALVAQEWSQRNLELIIEWERGSRQGRQPVYEFPDDYEHEMALTPDVAQKIVSGAYDRGKAGEDFTEAGLKRWFISPKWWNLACKMLGLSPDLNTWGNDVQPENGAVRGRKRPRNGYVLPENEAVRATYSPKTGQSLIKEEEKEEEEDQISLILARFANRKNDVEYKPSVRERNQMQQLLDEGHSTEQLIIAIDQAFDSRPSNAKPVRQFGFILSYVHRWLHPGGTQPTEVSAEALTGDTSPTGEPTGKPTGAYALEGSPATAGVPSAADTVHTPQPTDDPMAQVYSLLNAASIRGMDGVEDMFYDTPGICLGLRHFLDTPDPFSPDEIYDAVLAAVSRNVQPDRLVGYAETVLENARRETRERERSRQATSPAGSTCMDSGGAGQPVEESEVSSAIERDEKLHQVNGEKARTWQTVLSELELQMTRATFNTWLGPTTLLSWEDGKVLLGVPNEYVEDWLQNRLYTPLQRTLSGIAGEEVEVQFRLVGEQEM